MNAKKRFDPQKSLKGNSFSGKAFPRAWKGGQVVLGQQA
jgi:hypothetical protein